MTTEEENNKKKKTEEQKEESAMGTCSECGSNKVEVMTRVTGFFSKVNSWNKGKVGELKQRRDAIRANTGALAGSGSSLKKKKENKKEDEEKNEA